ncbi:Hypothetical predicted protein [Lecanosticta acicola]|uniref:Uncharacterized protein n=1 Tax=Lecanosticta acicola TaxID=111012 RepID=A0AAI9EFD0_9PEZI|nr:Hypothetical predicted protein [Lecanosticta acicola]
MPSAKRQPKKKTVPQFNPLAMHPPWLDAAPPLEVPPPSSKLWSEASPATESQSANLAQSACESAAHESDALPDKETKKKGLTGLPRSISDRVLTYFKSGKASEEGSAKLEKTEEEGPGGETLKFHETETDEEKAGEARN